MYVNRNIFKKEARDTRPAHDAMQLAFMGKPETEEDSVKAQRIREELEYAAYLAQGIKH